MLESREVDRDTSSSSFSFLSGCVGLGGEQVEQKLEEEKKEKEYHENFRNALRCIRPEKSPVSILHLRHMYQSPP